MKKPSKIYSYQGRILKSEGEKKLKIISLLKKYCMYKIAKVKSKKRRSLYKRVYLFYNTYESNYRMLLCSASVGISSKELIKNAR